MVRSDALTITIEIFAASQPHPRVPLPYGGANGNYFCTMCRRARDRDWVFSAKGNRAFKSVFLLEKEKTKEVEDWGHQV